MVAFGTPESTLYTIAISNLFLASLTDLKKVAEMYSFHQPRFLNSPVFFPQQKQYISFDGLATVSHT